MITERIWPVILVIHGVKTLVNRNTHTGPRLNIAPSDNCLPRTVTCDELFSHYENSVNETDDMLAELLHGNEVGSECVCELIFPGLYVTGGYLSIFLANIISRI